MLVTFDNSYEQETLPITSNVATVVETLLNTDRNIYLDLQSLVLKNEATIKNDGKNLTVDATTGNITDSSKVAFSNNTLLSICSNWDVKLSNELVHTSKNNNLYAQRAFLETELSHTEGCVKTKLVTQGYFYETDPSSFET